MTQLNGISTAIKQGAGENNLDEEGEIARVDSVKLKAGSY